MHSHPHSQTDCEWQ